MFKTKEEKQREAELEAQRLKQEEIEEAEKEIANERKRQEAFQKELNDDLKNNVVCYTTSDTAEKQVILNFFLNNNYICVQNDITCNKYNYYHSLTFVKKDFKDSFSSK